MGRRVIFLNEWESAALLWPKNKHLYSREKTRGSRVHDVQERETAERAKRRERDPHMYEYHAWASTVEALDSEFEDAV